MSNDVAATKQNLLDSQKEVLDFIADLIDKIDLKASHDRLLRTIDSFVGRIDKCELELADRDSQFEKLLAWARKVSEKTGIPLENL